MTVTATPTPGATTFEFDFSAYPLTSKPDVVVTGQIWKPERVTLNEDGTVVTVAHVDGMTFAEGDWAVAYGTSIGYAGGSVEEADLLAAAASLVRTRLGVTTAQLSDVALTMELRILMRAAFARFTCIGGLAGLDPDAGTDAGSDYDWFVDGLAWLASARLMTVMAASRSRGLKSLKEGDHSVQFADAASAATGDWLMRAEGSFGRISCIADAIATTAAAFNPWFVAGPSRARLNARGWVWPSWVEWSRA